MDDWLTVILAAGSGQRMQSSVPKVLHNICGKEIIRHVIDNAYELHSGQIIVVVSPDHISQIKEIVHRDLKPENTFIHNDVYKIADYGFC